MYLEDPPITNILATLRATSNISQDWTYHLLEICIPGVNTFMILEVAAALLISESLHVTIWHFAVTDRAGCWCV